MSAELPAVFIMGPTASGKTDLAMQLADRTDCHLISVDSALIYKDMNIGTAKPKALELEKYPHALIDFLDPSQSYSVAEFVDDATEEIALARQNNKLPVLVGGTMMYFKALIDGLSHLPPSDETIRQGIEAVAKEKGWQHIHELLAEVDPQAANRIHPNDPQRLTRALEVYRVSGKSMTELQENKRPGIEGTVHQFAITPSDRKLLHERIELRYKIMLEQGFVEEVKRLRERGDLHPDLPSIRCVGYRQVWDYLDKRYDYDEMVFRSVVSTRQLAKRQLTWLRGWEKLHWLETGDNQNIDILLNIINK